MLVVKNRFVWWSLGVAIIVTTQSYPQTNPTPSRTGISVLSLMGSRKRGPHFAIKGQKGTPFCNKGSALGDPIMDSLEDD